MADMKPGERLGCADCGTQIVVIKADRPVPHCCGKELEGPPLRPRAEDTIT